MSNSMSVSATIGGTADFKNEYLYDSLNCMTRVTQQSQSGGNAVATKRVDFAYNALGQFTTIDRYQNMAGTNLVAQTTFAYDSASRLTDLDHKQGSTVLAGYDYGYDQMSRITSINSTVEGLSTFTYDKTSQLTGADHASPRADESYSYDANGNRTMTGYQTGANNLTLSDGTNNYEYDDEGNRTRRTKISDGSYEEYAWDHRNRLTQVLEKDSSGNILQQFDYKYDVFDRRIEKSIDNDGPGAGASVISRYVYDGDDIALEFSGSNSLTHRYLQGPAVDQILADEDALNAILWPLTDNLGTVRDLLSSNGTIQNHLKYDSFGQVTSESNSSVNHQYGFTGRERDKETGLGYHRHRYLQSNGTWLSEDPSGFAPGDANLCRYVVNDPLNLVDGTGLSPTPPSDAIPDPSTATGFTPGGLLFVSVTVDGFEIPNLIIDSSSIKDKAKREDWEKKVMDDLAKLKKLPSGEELLVDIAGEKGRTVTIKPREAGMMDNRTKSPTGEAFQPRKPVDPIVHYDPDDRVGGKDERGGTDRPPYIGLGHELDHARRAIGGRLDIGALGPAGLGVTRDEQLATDFENRLRREHNQRNRDRLPPRIRPRLP